MDKENKEPNNFVREVRVSKGLSQKLLAQITGLPRNTIKRLEDCSTENPQLRTMAKIARALNVPVTDIFNL